MTPETTTQKGVANQSASVRTILGVHPMAEGRSAFKNLEEGEHYTVLAYSMRGDLHVPSIVEWSNGEVNNLREDDRDEILHNAREVVDGDR